MARMKKIKFSALNIKTHPHSPERYLELFKDLFQLRQRVQIWADYYGIIGFMRPVNSDNPLEGVTGDIYKFLNIDQDRPWINLTENKEAEPEDLYEVKIPDHIKPNMTGFRYVFYPDGHRLFFETQSDNNKVGANSILNFFRRLFAHETIKNKYGEVDVFLEPEQEKLEEILSIHRLKQLDMRITRPNPDDPDTYEKSVYERMEMENVDEYNYNLKGKDITPSEDTQALARVAASNGYVSGSGYDSEGRKVDESTKSHPLRKSTSYNPDIESPRDVFLFKTSRVFDDIKKWLSNI